MYDFAPMTRWLLLCLVAGACGGTGARSECAEGGALTDCPDADHTPEAACWRLVECAAIPAASSGDNNAFDYGRCIDRIESLDDAAEDLAIECIAASTCDSLKVDGSPDQPNAGQIHCFLIAGQN